MKITRNQWRGTTFADLKVGDVFYVAQNTCIKTDTLAGYNAVELATGLHLFVYECTDVTKVDAELVLR
jgi:hypothetical protein